MKRKGVVIAIGVALVLSLAGCTNAPSLAGPPLVAAEPNSSFSATDDVSAGGPMRVEATSVCAGAIQPVPVSDDDQAEQLGGATLAVPIDRGAMPHAGGQAVLNESGVPVAYRVAEGDVMEAIGARFCVGETWLHWVNAVRRTSDTLYAGDTLNLDAHTILSVGDQNGHISNNPLPSGFTIPPQR